jgi:hypothetical protein
MPRLKDLLRYVTKPGLEDIWLLLDIKFDIDADDVMRLIASTLAEVKPSRPWSQRVVLGCWAVSNFDRPAMNTITDPRRQTTFHSARSICPAMR